MKFIELIDPEMNEMVDYNTMKVEKLRKLLNDYKMKKASATTQNKKLQFQNQIGIIQSVIDKKMKEEMNESMMSESVQDSLQHIVENKMNFREFLEDEITESSEVKKGNNTTEWKDGLPETIVEYEDEATFKKAIKKLYPKAKKISRYLSTFKDGDSVVGGYNDVVSNKYWVRADAVPELGRAKKAAGSVKLSAPQESGLKVLVQMGRFKNNGTAIKGAVIRALSNKGLAELGDDMYWVPTAAGIKAGKELGASKVDLNEGRKIDDEKWYVYTKKFDTLDGPFKDIDEAYMYWKKYLKEFDPDGSKSVIASGKDLRQIYGVK